MSFRRKVMSCGARAIAVVVSLSFGFAAALSAAPLSEPPVNVDVIVSSTGPAAFAGVNEAQSLEIFEQDTNKHGGIHGRRLHFVLHDDQSVPQNAVQLAAPIIAAHVPVLLGPITVPTCFAVAPLVVQGPVQYCFSPGLRPTHSGFSFASSVGIDSVVPPMIRYARLRGWSHVAIVSATDATGQEADRFTQDALARSENAALKIVAFEHFNNADLSIASQAIKIAAARPDVVVAWANGAAFGSVLRALHDAGYAGPVIASAANMNYEQLAQYRAFLPKELLFNGFRYQEGASVRGGPLRAAIDEFTAAFREAGVRPSPIHAYAWDPAKIIVYALRTLGPDATGEQLQKYLEQLHGFVGVNGVYDFRNGDQHGLTDTAVVVVRWDPQKRDWIPVSEPGGKPLR